MIRHARNIILVISLAGNFFLAGMFVAPQSKQEQHGHRLTKNMRPPPGGTVPVSISQLFAVIRQLPDVTRARFKTQLEQDLPGIRAHHAELYKARTQLHDVMTQTPFDAIAFREQLDAVAAMRARQETAMADTLTRIMADLSVEERNILMQQIHRGPRKKRKGHRLHGQKSTHPRPTEMPSSNIRKKEQGDTKDE